MTALLLTAALLTAGPCRADLEFTDAVEQFVRTERPRAEPPEPFRSYLVQLGDQCYRCRDRAAAELRAASAADPRWLMWGRHDRDPEIRLRCNNLLRELTRCGLCRGSGCCRSFVERPDRPDDPQCWNCGAWGWNHGEEPAVCRSCDGAGAAWRKGAFD